MSNQLSICEVVYFFCNQILEVGGNLKQNKLVDNPVRCEILKYL
jgi:hypothetical protein